MTPNIFHRAILQPAFECSEHSFTAKKSTFNDLHNKKYITTPSYITPATTNK